MFMFLFSILLFNSTNEKCLEATRIPAYELHYTKAFEQYLHFQTKGNQPLAAVRLGIAKELVNHFQER